MYRTIPISTDKSRRPWAAAGPVGLWRLAAIFVIAALGDMPRQATGRNIRINNNSSETSSTRKAIIPGARQLVRNEREYAQDRKIGFAA